MTEMVVPPGADGERVDIWIARAMGIARTQVQRLLSEGSVSVDGRQVQKASEVRAGQVIRIEVPDQGSLETKPRVPYLVRHRDEHLLIVYKPAGVVVHPGAGVKASTLVESLAMEEELSELPGADRPGIVHRLDRDTSGLLVVAKTDQAYRELSGMMKSRGISRGYLALVKGGPDPATLTIDAPIGRKQRSGIRMAVTQGGRAARTHLTVIERLVDVALVGLKLETGRTHQIRVHLSHFGFPVIGDEIYGRSTMKLAAELGLERMFLHAESLEFVHPLTGELMQFREPLPPDLEKALDAARGRA